MQVKKYTQSGIFSMVVLLSVLLMCIIMLLMSGVDEPVLITIISLVILTVVICFLVFFKLTIIIDDTHLTFLMGIGMVRKSFPLSEIESCKAVTNSSISGFGIHMTSSGWLYNVSGRYAIELTFKNSGKRIRIGTDKPDEIAALVTSRIDGSIAGSYFDKGGNGGIYLIIAMVAATLVLPVILLTYGGRDTEVIIDKEALILKGMYGLSINYSDMQAADTVLMLPAIRSRTNGYASGKTLKGHFKLKDQSKALLFIRKGVPPYICIKSSGPAVYLNFDDPGKTREVFAGIRGSL